MLYKTTFPPSFFFRGLGRPRPEPCLDHELSERFLGRRVPTRFVNPAGVAVGEDPVILLGFNSDRPPLDTRFIGDVRTVVLNWLAFWSSFRLGDVRAAFRVEPVQGGEVLFEVRPVPGNLDVLSILAALRRNGACLKPTLH